MLMLTARVKMRRRTLVHRVDLIGKEGASFKSLSDPWADTCTPHGA